VTTGHIDPALQGAFAPTGTLRAVINLGNPILAGTDEQAGHPNTLTARPR